MPRRFLATVIAAVVLALPAMLPPVASAQAINDCGDLDRYGVGIKNVTSREVSCPRARRLARRHERTDRMPGFRCRTRKLQQYFYDIRCTRSGGQVVRYQYATD